MLRARVFGYPLAWRVISAIAAHLVAIQLLLAQGQSAQPQANSAPALMVTPSLAVVAAGDTAALSAVDETGKPLTNVRWSISSQIANLQEENGQVFVQGRQAGRATLTATANNHSATAIISVVEGAKLAPGTVRWSLQPMPGFQSLMVVQAAPTDEGPAFYSVEWSKSENAIVRALSEFGQQIWMTHLASSASPSTLQHVLLESGQVFQNEQLVSDNATFIIGAKERFFYANNPFNPDSLGLPADGHNILLHATGDASGGIILLERGRFRDSLVDLNAADGSELWRYRSEGRLAKNWTANWNMDVGIVETLAKPASSSLLVLNTTTGQLRFRIPFPASSSTIDGYRCQDPQRNILKNLRPSRSGSVLTSTDGNIYVQVETFVESLLVEACKSKHFWFDNNLLLLSVTPEGETDWKTFQRIHAEGEGDMVAQNRAFAGETIPDGFGGVLAAWTHISPDPGSPIHSEARLSRIGPSGQRDFILPMPYWTKGFFLPFDANMILGEGNFLYAVNGPQLLRLDTQSGEVNWVRHPPTGEVKLDHATVGGGLLVSNAGVLVHFDAQGNGAPISWTVSVSNPEDIGLAQVDTLEKKPLEPLQLRETQFCLNGNVLAVEDGAPYGRGTLLYFAGR